MIRTVIQISLQRLRNSPAELLLTFVMPIAFFSVFALIFGGRPGSDSAPKINVLVIDSAKSPISSMVVQQLRLRDAIRWMTIAPAEKAENGAASEPEQSTLALVETSHRSTDPPEIETAKQLVQRGEVTVAILLDQSERQVTARLLTDSSNPIAGQLLQAIVQQTISGVNQVAARQAIAPTVQPSPPEGPPSAVTLEDVMRADENKPVVSMYAAGIAVMFLLFGATGGGGVLLEEKENRTLDRLLATRLTMDQLLLGKWCYLTGLGCLQTTLMFIWGAWMFDVDLAGHLDGFIVMTIVTAAAASSFGLLLATLCRTRGALNGLSVILVLTMSALGGSMVPRYIMSESLQTAGLWTFNAWALDGYNKVFWRELPVSDLWPQVMVLLVSGFVMLIAARLLAFRWEIN
ncbi:Inner membrane transport permease YbhR [Roseimaritima multifibrata]|uniref:Inner membrane transport permease YbhR n=1 Tax=Roseimaritima multifibrata TaxID=1930274 RepID=A0A517MEZ4_9BACT|nr:Inner membrane transport permease YbhR [Roseimaritima multifibrata]